MSSLLSTTFDWEPAAMISTDSIGERLSASGTSKDNVKQERAVVARSLNFFTKGKRFSTNFVLKLSVEADNETTGPRHPNSESWLRPSNAPLCALVELESISSLILERTEVNSSSEITSSLFCRTSWDIKKHNALMCSFFKTS
ncbi:hypothetical protein OGAPHI_002676 [Ogataea philodendri]|uniref:Uncharacterized protein n=1 Tax=Ogataea philodendri TaxID=1378263 RepID=A0A9P8PBV0_9ASCO|nr:uncharacterized protein OGAPHI_002676 [Ogataea philodendri]KAH3668921.1 hypothetical protein OGAPHI_002676 [Ogataea philodendri]